MLNSRKMYGLIPSGKFHEVNNLVKHAGGVILFDTITDADVFLSHQVTLDNKDYIKKVEVMIVVNEKKDDRVSE